MFTDLFHVLISRRSRQVGRLATLLFSSGCLVLLMVGALRSAPGFKPSAYLPVDFAAYYVAAKILASGDGASLYDTQLQHQLLVRDVPGIREIQDGPPPFLYPPAAVAFGLPLAWLPFHEAAYIWLAFNVVALMGYTWLLMRLAFLKGGTWATAGALAAVFLFPPTQEALLLGQITPLLALTIALGLLLAFTKPISLAEETAGAALSLASSIKLFPAALFFPWLLALRWRLVAAGLATAAVVVACGLMLPQGMQATIVYLVSVVPNLPRPWSPLNLSVASTLGMAMSGAEFRVPVFSRENVLDFHFGPILWTGSAAEPLATGASLVVLLAGALGTIRLRHDPLKASSLWLTTLLVALPLAWGHYYVLLLISLALLARYHTKPYAFRWGLAIFFGFGLNRFYRPMMYLGIHPAFTNMLALGPVLALWMTELLRALTTSAAPCGGRSTTYRSPASS